MAQMVKNLPTMQETWFQSLGQEDTLEKGMVLWGNQETVYRIYFAGSVVLTK